MTVPDVAIVCAWFNRADYIKKTLDSLLSQDFADFEILIINDGSTDPRVRMILDGYKDHRLRIIHQENMGFVKTISKAVASTTARYIAIQGAGDVSLPGRLLAQFELMERSPKLGCVATFYDFIDSKNDRVIDTVTAPQSIDSSLLARCLPITHGTNFYRREYYDLIGGYDERFVYAQDWDLLNRMSSVASIEVVPQVYYLRYSFDDGASYSPKKRIVQSAYVKLAKQLPSTRCINSPISEPKVDGDHYIYLARNLPLTLRMLGGCLKRRTFGFVPSVVGILARQLISLFTLRF